jgi:hypothetical protein
MRSNVTFTGPFQNSTRLEGPDHAREAAIQVHDGDLRVRRLYHREAACGHIRAGVGDVVCPLTRIDKLTDIAALQLNAPAEREHPALSRFEDLREAALADHQDAFVIADQNTAQHSNSPPQNE